MLTFPRWTPTVALIAVLFATSAWSDNRCLKVDPGNTAPVANEDFFSWPPTQPLNVLANDSDADLDPIRITRAFNATNGTVSVAADGRSVTFAPNAGQSSGSFDYEITDDINTVRPVGQVTLSTTVLGASFSYSCNGVKCNFVAQPQSTAGISNYVWNFGDGTPSATWSGVNYYKEFPPLAAGATRSHSVVLTVNYYGGQVATATRTVSLTGLDYTVGYSVTQTGLTTSVLFLSSTFPRGTATTRYRYTLGSNAIFTGNPLFDGDPMGAGSPVSILRTVSFDLPGTHDIWMIVQLENYVNGHWILAPGDPAIVARRTLLVVDGPPHPGFVVATSSGPSFTFDPGPESSDDRPFNYDAYQFQWDFGDGEVGRSECPGVRPLPVSHTYRRSGQYNVVFTITDVQGGHVVSASRSITAAAPNLAPVAVVHLGCSLAAGFCSFSGLGSRDDYDAIVDYEWTMGDGDTSTGRTVPNWVYPPGCYAVQLKVRDDEGLTHTSLQTVTVGAPTPRPDTVLADVHAGTYDWISPYGVYARNPTGNLNGILEPGETVLVEPFVQVTPSTVPRTDGLFGLESTSPSVAVAIAAPAATFDQTTGLTDCWRLPAVDRGHCFAVGATLNGTRAEAHVDFKWNMPRTPGGSDNVPLSLHIGNSFVDVPVAAWYYGAVESILHAGLTSGCSSNSFCPDTVITRAQIPVWLLRAKYGSKYTPPRCQTPPYSDVDCNAPFADWIAQVASEGIASSGQFAPTYRPNDAVTRGEIAAFIVKTLLNGQPVPVCSPDFTDVPCTATTEHWAAKFVSELKRRGATSGCGNGNYCPDATVSRGEAAMFFTKAWNLSVNRPVCPPGTIVHTSAAAASER